MYYKERLQKAVENNLKVISNHYDNEAETFICKELENALDALEKACESFEIIKATFNAWVEDNSEGIDENELWDRCFHYMADCGGDFDEMWETFEKIEY